MGNTVYDHMWSKFKIIYVRCVIFFSQEFLVAPRNGIIKMNNESLNIDFDTDLNVSLEL